MAYFTVQDWMVKELKLKGAERDVFAIVYGISQDGESDYHGSLQYISDLTGYSRNSVCTALNSLTDKELLIKVEVERNGKKCCRYRTNYLHDTVQPTCTTVQPTCMNNNKYINKTISKDIVGTNTTYSDSKGVKKKNLYEKCADLIDEYTNNTELRDNLKSFLKICLENSREAGRPFYQNMWKSKLTKLSELSDNTDTQIKIVKQTLDNGWSNFYDYKGDNKKQSGRYTVDEPTDMGYVVDRASKRRGRTDGEKY